MLYELKESEYGKAFPLFNGLYYNIAVESIVKKYTRGRIYADDPKNPKTAVVWNLLDTVVVGGSGSEAKNGGISRLIEDELVPEAKKFRIPEFNIHFNPAIEGELAESLEEFHPSGVSRGFYLLEWFKYDWKSKIVPEISLERIDGEMLGRKDLKNWEDMFGWVRGFWPSNRSFAENGIGYAAVDGNSVAGWCLSVYRGERKLELGLVTAPEYRNRGIAKITASACVEYSISNGIEPVWNCSDANRASAGVAESIGFKKVRNYRVMRILLNDEKPRR